MKGDATRRGVVLHLHAVSQAFDAMIRSAARRGYSLSTTSCGGTVGRRQWAADWGTRMIRILGLAFAVLASTSTVAGAQFRIDSLLDKGPVRFGAGTEIELSRSGSDVVRTMTVSGVLRGAQTTINSLLPEVNRKLSCDGNNFSAEFTQVTIESESAAFSEKATLNITADARIARCRRVPVTGEVAVIIPLSVVIKDQAVELRAQGARVESRGVVAAGFIPVPRIFVAAAGKRVAQRIDQALAVINDPLRRALLDDSSRAKGNKLAMQSASVAFDGNDLFVRVRMSRSAPLSMVNGSPAP